MLFALVFACATDLPGAPDPVPSGPLPTIDASEPMAAGVQLSPDYIGGSGAMLTGVFADAPPLDRHLPGRREGGCVVMEYTPTPCEPSCDSDSACVDGECIAFPERENRGVLTWSPGSGPDREVDVNLTTSYFDSIDSGGAGTHTLRIGDDVAQTTLIDAPIPEADWTAQLMDRERGEGVRLTWGNPIDGARVRTRMTDCTGSHGGLAANEISCDVPDTGELVLHGELMDIMEDGAWDRGECGTQILERYSRRALGPDAAVESVAWVQYFYFP